MGDNREVWCANTNSTVQRTQYYPSGLPIAYNDGDNPGTQKRKYNGKEFVEMHGYDTYDIVWRQYYPAIMRFQTQDPEIENDYDLSPYSMCDNNMVLKTDPDGRVAVVDNIVGGLFGGAFDYGMQVAANYAQGNSNPWTNNINLVSIGTAAVAGALTSGGSAIIKSVAGRAVVETGQVVVNNSVRVTTNGHGVKTDVETNPLNVAKNVAIDKLTGKAIGKVGSKVEGYINKKLITNAGNLRNTAKVMVRATGNNVTRETKATAKTYINKGAKVFSKTVEKSTEAFTSGVKENIKSRTDLKER